MARRSIASALALLALVACDDDTLDHDPPDDTGTEDAKTEPKDAGFDDAEAPEVGTIDSGAPVAELVTLDLGEVVLSNGSSDAVSFELPSDVTTFTIIISGPLSTMFVVGRLDGPTGNLVSDDPSTVSPIEGFLLGPFAAQFKSPNRVTGKEGVASALFPNNPAVSVTGGNYDLRVRGLVVANSAPYSGNVHVEVAYKTTISTRGLLDVHVYLSGAAGLTTRTATSTLLTAALARLEEIYAQADIELGAVVFHDIDASFQTRDVTAASLGPMFQLSEGNGPGLHYFLVDRFVGGIPGGVVGGIAGGLPGPPGHAGSPSSGVAVAVTAASGDSDVLAHVMAHEGGHWLGLFHTSEITGTNDQLDDTPVGQSGTTHLMYPAVGGGQTLSPSQADVMHRHLEVIPQ
ncbi:MAG: hypothetical protein HYV07_10125 [Deltaproteobacteria bacterium]|nr:hypothetical protein [Deltaproteobacteria bacterium]